MAAPTAIETPSGPAGGNERALIACDWTDVPGSIGMVSRTDVRERPVVRVVSRRRGLRGLTDDSWRPSTLTGLAQMSP